MKRLLLLVIATLQIDGFLKVNAEEPIARPVAFNQYGETRPHVPGYAIIDLGADIAPWRVSKDCEVLVFRNEQTDRGLEKKGFRWTAGSLGTLTFPPGEPLGPFEEIRAMDMNADGVVVGKWLRNYNASNDYEQNAILVWSSGSLTATRISNPFYNAEAARLQNIAKNAAPYVISNSGSIYGALADNIQFDQSAPNGHWQGVTNWNTFAFKGLQYTPEKITDIVEFYSDIFGGTHVWNSGDGSREYSWNGNTLRVIAANRSGDYIGEESGWNPVDRHFPNITQYVKNRSVIPYVPFAINDAGQVIGTTFENAGGRMQLSGEPQINFGISAYPVTINSRKRATGSFNSQSTGAYDPQIVGYFHDKPTLWETGSISGKYRPKTLNDLVSTQKDWKLNSVEHINDFGAMVGTGWYQDRDSQGHPTGVSKMHGYLLLPVLVKIKEIYVSPTRSRLQVTLEINGSDASGLNALLYSASNGTQFTWTIAKGSGQFVNGFLSTMVNGIAETEIQHTAGTSCAVQAELTHITTPNFDVDTRGLVIQQGLMSSSETITELDDAAGPLFRKIALNGRPIWEPLPDQKAHTDSEPERSYIDALSLRLRHSVTDIYIPIPNSELSLCVRRNWEGEVWNDRSDLKPNERPDRLFGSGWSTNLGSNLHFVYHTPINGEVTVVPDYALVTDEDGVVFRFLILRENEIERFFPLPSSSLDQATYLSTLTDDGLGVYTFKKQHGTSLKFRMVSELNTTLPYDRIESANNFIAQQHHFAALEMVSDRFGNFLSYEHGVGLMPTKITSNTGQSIVIEPNADGHVGAVFDPKLSRTDYGYEAIAAVPGGGKTMNIVTKPADIENRRAATQYSFTTITEADSRPTPQHPKSHYHLDLEKITEPEAKVFSFQYVYDRSREVFNTNDGYYPVNGIARNISQVSLPDGIGSATFQNHSLIRAQVSSGKTGVEFKGYRTSYVIDAEGHSRAYDFQDNQVVLLDQFKPYGLKPENPLVAAKMVIFKRMTVKYYSGANVQFQSSGESLNYGGDTLIGSESFEFSPEAGMAISRVTDFNSNITEFSYDNLWNRQALYPWLHAEYPFGMYNQPTKRKNAAGKIKTYTYDPQWRLSLGATDELGRRTVFELGLKGQHRSTSVYAPNDSLVQFAESRFEDPIYPAFPTTQIIHKIPSAESPAWEADLVTRFVSDGKGRVEKEIRDPDGLALTTQFTYDENSNKKTTVDSRQNVTRFDYDKLNRLVMVTFPATGTPLQVSAKGFGYDLRGNKIRETDEENHSTLFEYDGLDQVITQARDMNGNISIDPIVDLVTSFQYNKVGSKTSVTDPKGYTTAMVYDAIQRIASTTTPSTPEAPAGHTTTFFYGANAGSTGFSPAAFKPTRSIDARSFETIAEYDELYRTKTISTQYESNPPKFSIAKSDYDDADNLRFVTDPLLKVTETRYDDLNRPTDVIYHDGTIQSSFYTSTGLKWKLRDERQIETEMQYDQVGRTRFVFGPLVDNGAGVLQRPVTETTYDEAGNIRSIVDPRTETTVYIYDARNRKISENLPLVLDAETGQMVNPILQWTYNGVGNVIRTTDARGAVTDKRYDEANRLKETEMPAAPVNRGAAARALTKVAYDSNGNIETATDANSHVTTNTYDVLNRLETTTDAENIMVIYGYDAVGNRVSVKDGLLHETRFEYDGLKRNTKIIDATNHVTVSKFDAGELISRTDSKNQVTHYTYDFRNRLQTVSYDGRNQDNRLYVYDDAGNLESVTVSGYIGKANVHYTHDALNRTQTEESAGVKHWYTYDLAGNRVKIERKQAQGDVSERTIRSDYDALNRLSRMTEGVDLATNGRVTQYRYDKSGNSFLKTMPNGDTVTMSYDALNRLDVSDAQTGGGTLLQRFEQGYDKAGNVKTIVESYADPSRNRLVENTYDDVNRLKTETSTGSQGLPEEITYLYNDANSRTKKSVSGGPSPGIVDYHYNNLNQLTDYTDGVVLSYDFNGNRTGSTQQNASYVYDYENRLVSLTQNDVSYSYIYDYRSRRVERVEDATTTKVVFSGGTSVQEFEGGLVKAEFVRGSDYGGGIGGMLYSLRQSVPSFTYSNQRGDVVAKTDATGAITWQASYGAFGKRSQEFGTTLDRQKANTKEEDPTGLLNEGFRYRDIETGTFITRDPTGFVDGPNLYAYVSQNPWSKFDPEGLCGWAFGTPNEVIAGQAMAQSIHQTAQESKAAYSAMRADGSSAIGAGYAAGGHFVGSMVGVRGIHDAITGDTVTQSCHGGLGTQQLTTGQRWVSGVTGAVGVTGLSLAVAGPVMRVVGLGGSGASIESTALQNATRTEAEVAAERPVLNLGAGSNPMPGAVNLDIRAGIGIDIVADASSIPVEAGHFGAAHSINPFGFQPVAAETARVMAPGSLLRVSGTARNPFALPVSSEIAEQAGFRQIGHGPIVPEHMFGNQSTTTGAALKTGTSTTTTYIRE